MRPGRRESDLRAEKVDWDGVIVAVQPRIRLWRSFDQRSHEYPGYVLRVDGTIGDEKREFLVAVGEGVQAKHGLQAGDAASGKCVAVGDPRGGVLGVGAGQPLRHPGSLELEFGTNGCSCSGRP